MHSPRFDAHFKPKETQTLKDLFCAGVLAITIKYFAFRNGYFVNYTIIFIPVVTGLVVMIKDLTIKMS